MTRGERGSALVEAGVAIPVLVLLLAGVADFGRTFGRCHEVISAARDGVQVVMNAYPSCARTTYDKSITDAIAGDSATPGLAGTVSRFYTCPDSRGDDSRSRQYSAPQSCTGERLYLRIVASAPFTAVMPHPKILSLATVRSTAIVRIR